MRTISHADSEIGPVSPPPHPHYHHFCTPITKKKKYASIFVILASKLHAADPEPGV